MSNIFSISPEIPIQSGEMLNMLDIFWRSIYIYKFFKYFLWMGLVFLHIAIGFLQMQFVFLQIGLVFLHIGLVFL